MNAEEKQHNISIDENFPEFKSMMSQFNPNDLAEIVREIKESGTFTEEELNLICGSNTLASKVLNAI